VSNSPAKAVTIGNQNIPTGTVTFPATTAGQFTFNLQVFPFTTSYNVWAGGCTTGNPLLYGKPGITALATPGGTTSVTVRQPSITLNGASGVPGYSGLYPLNTSGVKVYYTSIDAGCTERYVQTSGTGGALPTPGAPYGNYKVCAELSGSYGQLDSFLNQVFGGSSVTIAYKGTGTCPP
jgi:hypothetical protein